MNNWGKRKSGKLLSVNRNITWFKRILWEFRAGKMNIRKNSRLRNGNILPARKNLVSDIPAGSRERDWDFFSCSALAPGPLTFLPTWCVTHAWEWRTSWCSAWHTLTGNKTQAHFLVMGVTHLLAYGLISIHKLPYPKTVFYVGVEHWLLVLHLDLVHCTWE